MNEIGRNRGALPRWRGRGEQRISLLTSLIYLRSISRRLEIWIASRFYTRDASKLNRQAVAHGTRKDIINNVPRFTTASPA